MIVASVDTKGLERRLAGMVERAGPAGLEAARSGADHFVGFMADFAPVDTGRYKRAWIQAGNMAGLTPRALPALKQSRWRERFERVLDEQIERHIRRIAEIHGILDRWYFSRGRPLNAWARRKQREAQTLTARLVRAVEQKRRFLGADAPVLVFDLFGAGRGYRVNGKTYRHRLATVRDKVYGGFGETVVMGGEGRVRLVNREPHVRIVERRYRLIARAKAAVRRFTNAEARRIFVEGVGG